jgi:hypothetical protein
VRKIPITIRKFKPAPTSTPISGEELIRKVTHRAITRLLCGVFNIQFSMFEGSKVYYQPVFTRCSMKTKTLKTLRLGYESSDILEFIDIDEIHNIGVSEMQILDFLKDSSSKKIDPKK